MIGIKGSLTVIYANGLIYISSDFIVKVLFENWFYSIGDQNFYLLTCTGYEKRFEGGRKWVVFIFPFLPAATPSIYIVQAGAISTSLYCYSHNIFNQVIDFSTILQVSYKKDSNIYNFNSTIEKQKLIAYDICSQLSLNPYVAKLLPV